MKYLLKGVVICGLIISSILYGSEESPTISRLFFMPKAKVLGTYVINIAGGSTYYPFEERSLLGIASIGLGDVAEVEINTRGVFNNLPQGVINVPATSFKMRLLKESRYIPAMSMMLEMSPIWYSQKVHRFAETDKYVQACGEGDYVHRTKHGTFYVLLDKRIAKVGFSLGLSMSDYRVKTRGPWPSELEWEEAQNTLYCPHVGVQLPINKSTSVIAEYDRWPMLIYAGPDSERVEPVDMGMLGIRFFFTEFTENISVDIGIVYTSEFKGIADAVLHTNLNLTLSLLDISKLFRKPKE